MNKNVIVVNPLNTWWSFQLTLELALRYKNRGHKVFWYNAAIKNKKKFEMNKTDYINGLVYRSPIKIIKKILSMQDISGKYEYVEFPKKKKIQIEFRDIEDLKKYEIDGSPLGAIWFSAIASKLKHTGFKLEEISRELRFYSSFTRALESELTKKIIELKPSLLVTINDRLPGSSLSVSIARKLKVDTRVFYWGSEINKIVEYKNSLYDFDEWRDMIDKNYQELKLDEKKLTKAKLAIDELLANPSADSKTFLSNQIIGKSIHSKKKLVVFYAASEHEHSPLTFKKNNKFKSQYEAFKALQNICIVEDYQLVIKYHPIRKKRFSIIKKKNALNDWGKIKINPKVIQLQPDSKVDTYQLIMDSDLNVTWSSTVGKESIIREKPTIIMGDTTWLDTKWKIHAWNHKTLQNLLKINSIALKKEALLPWFYFMQEYGDDFEYVKTSNYNPEVNGIKVLQPRFMLLPFYKLAVKMKQRKLI